MKDFPVLFRPADKEYFSERRRGRIACYLRRTIYENVIQGDETDYIDLDAFAKLYAKGDLRLVQGLISQITTELKDRGWKCATSYGQTALFIYSSESPPINCYPDGVSTEIS